MSVAVAASAQTRHRFLTGIEPGREVRLLSLGAFAIGRGAFKLAGLRRVVMHERLEAANYSALAQLVEQLTVKQFSINAIIS